MTGCQKLQVLQFTFQIVVPIFSLGTIEWDGRTVIGGISLKWADGTIDTVGTIGEDGNRICEMEVPDGEHISFVIGNSGWYIDSLTFVTSSGRKLGSCKYE